MPDGNLLKILEILIFDINNQSAHKRISLRIKRNKGEIIPQPEYFVTSETGEKIKISFCSQQWIICGQKPKFLESEERIPLMFVSLCIII
jgi:hypothetical protein